MHTAFSRATDLAVLSVNVLLRSTFFFGIRSFFTQTLIFTHQSVLGTNQIQSFEAIMMPQPMEANSSK
jgi:hypothetical protein